MSALDIDSEREVATVSCRSWSSCCLWSTALLNLSIQTLRDSYMKSLEYETAATIRVRACVCRLSHKCAHLCMCAQLRTMERNWCKLATSEPPNKAPRSDGPVPSPSPGHASDLTMVCASANGK